MPVGRKAVSKTKKIEDQVDEKGGSRDFGKYKKTTETSVTNTEAVINSIMLLEAELTKVQKAKTKAIETLSKIRFEKVRLESESTENDTVDDWITTILEENERGDVSSDE